MDGEQEYKCMTTKIKEISLEFTDDLKGSPSTCSSAVHCQEKWSTPEGKHCSETPHADEV